MNKHLLETKLRSIEHYNAELKRFEEAKEVTRSTKKDLVDSLKEYLPWEQGDVIMKGSQIYMFDSFDCMEESSGTVYFRVWLKAPNTRHSNIEWDKLNSSYSTRISLNEIHNYKVLTNINKP